MWGMYKIRDIVIVEIVSPPNTSAINIMHVFLVHDPSFLPSRPTPTVPLLHPAPTIVWANAYSKADASCMKFSMHKERETHYGRKHEDCLILQT